MKFLHTGDLHLGKIFYEQPLTQDQEHMLGSITAELEAANGTDEPYDALCIAGDIYDRAVPPPEAVALFDSFLTRVHASCPALHVFIIPGNHDSARRLSFASGLLDSQNIHICTSFQQMTVPVILETRTSGKTERAAVYCMPFLTPGFTGTGSHRQQDMAQEAVSLIAAAHETSNAGIPAVLCAHLFARSGVASESERLFIGTAEQVPADMFAPFAYTALGHLHTCQRITDTVWYAGAPLAYSFGEAGSRKYLLRVRLDTHTAAVSVEKIPCLPLRPVAKLSGSFEQFYRGEDTRFAAYADSYLEISCTDRTLVENPMAQLKAKYPYLLSVQQETAVSAAALSSITERRELLASNKNAETLSEQIFAAFMNDVYSPLPGNFEEETEAFAGIIRELNGRNE